VAQAAANLAHVDALHTVHPLTKRRLNSSSKMRPIRAFTSIQA
jgi:hypothetical protein